VILTAVVQGGAACGTLSPDLDRVIAISTAVDSVVPVADTLHAHAAALSARGDTVAATIYWSSFDTTVLAVADSVAGLFVGRKAGTTNLQARAGNLRTNPIAVRVSP
jgi:hypothetical protein